MHTQDHEATVLRDVVCSCSQHYSSRIFTNRLDLRLQSAPGGKFKKSLLVRGVLEAVAAVEHAEVVHVLDIALAEIETDVEALGEEVESVEGFGLGFGYGRDVGRAREGLVAYESAADVLDDDSLFVSVGGGLVVQQRDFLTGTIGVAETGSRSVMPWGEGLGLEL